MDDAQVACFHVARDSAPHGVTVAQTYGFAALRAIVPSSGPLERAAATGGHVQSPSVSVMKKERRPCGRHAGEPHRRLAFEEPGSGPWRTDVIAFVGLPLLLLAFSWIAVATFRAGGVDRWNGLSVLCGAAVLVIPAVLRWRRLHTGASARVLGRLYIVLGVVALVGVVVGLT
jgi:hypothetical protein